MEATTLRTVVAAAAAAVAVCFSQLAVPLAVLLVVMLVDYLTGIGKAVVTKTLCSRCGISGILKKIGQLAVVAVGLVTDYVIVHAASTLGVEVGIRFAVGLLVVFWLIVNELISILENVSKMGVKLPVFLQKIIERLKVTIEKKSEN